jgi:hypothetical protein
MGWVAEWVYRVSTTALAEPVKSFV